MESLNSSFPRQTKLLRMGKFNWGVVCWCRSVHPFFYLSHMPCPCYLSCWTAITNYLIFPILISLHHKKIGQMFFFIVVLEHPFSFSLPFWHLKIIGFMSKWKDCSICVTTTYLYLLHPRILSECSATKISTQVQGTCRQTLNSSWVPNKTLYCRGLRKSCKI